ncbi:progestin and adipoQ receptor family member 3-like isoform X2 [Oncorhynchus clarkii lewisi]
MSTVLPASGANREDYVIYCIALFCFQVCMLCSAGYHMFSCHLSEKTCHRWLALDFVGISVGILGCYIPGVFYAFYCITFWRQVYLVTALALILAVFLAQIHPHYHSKEWRHQRTAIFCSVAGYGIIPAGHWVWLNEGLGSAVVQLFLPRVIVMYLIAGAAFLFYISKIPERCFPGQLNYLGASHQVWHVLVVFLLYWWHQTAVYIMKFRHSQPCPPFYTQPGLID